MHWLLNGRELRERGILGMNRRNAEFVLDCNSRESIGLADDKLCIHELCMTAGIATPGVFGAVRHIAELRHLRDRMAGLREVVIKPARGSGGRGVLVLTGGTANGFRRSGGAECRWPEIADHIADVLCGMHSLGAEPDIAMLQERVRLHPDFAPIATGGIPDLRIIVYRGVPAMAMLRLPTNTSGGRANLHQGGLGVGVDLATGVTNHAVQSGRSIRRHPDTGTMLLGRPVPRWHSALTLSIRAAEAVKLGYLGVDIVVDAVHGPQLLEVNARPGLAIQHANSAGLAARLDAIDRGESPDCAGAPVRALSVA